MPYEYGTPALQPHTSKDVVWAPPFSLAATRGITWNGSPYAQACAHGDTFLLFSFPPGTEMFHFPGFALRGRDPASTPHMWSGFPHSDISGSKATNRLPEAFRRLVASFIATLGQGIHRAPFTSPVRRPEYHNRFCTLTTVSYETVFQLPFFVFLFQRARIPKRTNRPRGRFVVDEHGLGPPLSV